MPDLTEIADVIVVGGASTTNVTVIMLAERIRTIG